MSASAGAPSPAASVMARKPAAKWLSPPAWSPSTIAAAWAKIGDLDTALKTVKDMGDSAYAQWTRNAAIEQIVEARLKGAGMHWERTNVNPMLALRNAVCNDPM